jgi:hypothetical protein
MQNLLNKPLCDSRLWVLAIILVIIFWERNTLLLLVEFFGKIMSYDMTGWKYVKYSVF